MLFRSADDLLYVYAVGRVRDSEWPIIEVWCMEKIWAHRDQYNKQGGKHYSFKNPEMYARKIPLLQVLKYMPTSIELTTALDVTNAVDVGKSVVLEGNYVTVRDDDEEPAVTKESAGVAVPRAKSDAAKTTTSEKPQSAASDMFRQSAGAAANPETGELTQVTDNQLKFLRTKIGSMEIPESAISAMLSRLGAASLDNITFEQYDTIRAELLAME